MFDFRFERSQLLCRPAKGNCARPRGGESMYDGIRRARRPFMMSTCLCAAGSAVRAWGPGYVLQARPASVACQCIPLHWRWLRCGAVVTSAPELLFQTLLHLQECTVTRERSSCDLMPALAQARTTMQTGKSSQAWDTPAHAPNFGLFCQIQTRLWRDA